MQRPPLRGDLTDPAATAITRQTGQLPPGRTRPRISAFYGVVIYMYRNERDHPVAHFHAGRRASVSADGNVLAGSPEPRTIQFVQE
jgi:Domain of unknown function (DUF4160)